jgi:hypothetical protein
MSSHLSHVLWVHGILQPSFVSSVSSRRLGTNLTARCVELPAEEREVFGIKMRSPPDVEHGFCRAKLRADRGRRSCQSVG